AAVGVSRIWRKMAKRSSYAFAQEAKGGHAKVLAQGRETAQFPLAAHYLLRERVENPALRTPLALSLRL
ncbi:MAG: hypothetical protein ABR906_12960, partial [Terracidiphilus sp.]